MALALPVATAPAPRRFTILIGDDHGLPGDPPLRFAEADAKAMRATLHAVSGVRPEDSELLLDASADQVLGALTRWGRLLAAEHVPGDQLIVYVSGHAADGKLRLAGSTLSIEVLTHFLERSPTSVAVLVLDTCESGEAIRLKGLRPGGAPVIEANPLGLQGRVILSSSGPDEYSQESAAIHGSFFTHNLIEALRGAADVSGDGRVTLAEAYLYAYRATLESTFGTPGGVQHPSYRFDLRGAGELVLSRPRTAPARLRIADGRAGEWLIARAGGTVVDRIDKASGPAVLALVPGTYQVQTQRGGRLFRATVKVAPSGETILPDDALTEAPLWATLLKGPGAPWSLELTLSAGNGLVPAMHGAFGVAVALDRLWGHPLGPFDWTWAQLEFRTARALGPVSFRENELSASVGIGFMGRLGPLTWRAGVGPGAVLVRQGAIASGARLGLGFGLDGRLEVHVPLARRTDAVVGASGGPRWAPRSRGITLGWQGQAELGVAISLE